MLLLYRRNCSKYFKLILNYSRGKKSVGKCFRGNDIVREHVYEPILPFRRSDSSNIADTNLIAALQCHCAPQGA